MAEVLIVLTFLLRTADGRVVPEDLAVVRDIPTWSVERPTRRRTHEP